MPLLVPAPALAGENLQALLEQRQEGLDKPLVMSDALSRNEADEAELIRCHCFAHARRKFSDIEEGAFPDFRSTYVKHEMQELRPKQG